VRRFNNHVLVQIEVNRVETDLIEFFPLRFLMTSTLESISSIRRTVSAREASEII
jgi:hypothetical protein